jgi:hypothetical protein
MQPFVLILIRKTLARVFWFLRLVLQLQDGLDLFKLLVRELHDILASNLGPANSIMADEHVSIIEYGGKS